MVVSGDLCHSCVCAAARSSSLVSGVAVLFAPDSAVELVHPVTPVLDSGVRVAVRLLWVLPEYEQPVEALLALAPVVDLLALVEDLGRRFGDDRDIVEGVRCLVGVFHCRVSRGEPNCLPTRFTQSQGGVRFRTSSRIAHTISLMARQRWAQPVH